MGLILSLELESTNLAPLLSEAEITNLPKATQSLMAKAELKSSSLESPQCLTHPLSCLVLKPR